jgi:hypothetical protein
MSLWRAIVTTILHSILLATSWTGNGNVLAQTVTSTNSTDQKANFKLEGGPQMNEFWGVLVPLTGQAEGNLQVRVQLHFQFVPLCLLIHKCYFVRLGLQDRLC